MNNFFILGSGRSLGEGNGTHSGIVAWEVPWVEESGVLQSKNNERAGVARLSWRVSGR